MRTPAIILSAICFKSESFIYDRRLVIITGAKSKINKKGALPRHLQMFISSQDKLFQFKFRGGRKLLPPFSPA
jgi:hypothetical protein